MKLICGRDELSRCLQTVLRSVGARAGIPALAGVLMELTGDRLTLTTTDLELTTRVWLDMSGETGQTVVPARLLADVVKSLPSEDVELVTENGTVRIGGGRARFGLRCLDPEDFPRVEPAGELRTFVLPGATLAAALGQVVPAASRDETRPVLTGVLFEGDGDELRLVATDSYRLAIRVLEAPGCGSLKLLVPARAVAEVARIVGDGDVTVTIASSQVAFESGNVTIVSRLIEGEFPAYRQLLPENLPSRLEAERSVFVDSLRRVAVLAQDATPLYVELDEGGVRLTCQSQGVGEGVEEVDATYRGEPMRVAFNPTYLENGISAVEEDRFRIELTDSQRPVLIFGEKGEGFTYLLMPIRVS